MLQQYVRILLILIMAAVVCGPVSAASVGIVAETHVTSGAQAPVCTAPCECISLTEAMQRWGANGYDYCSKTVCGQSADAMTQYYCLHQAQSMAPAVTSAPAQVTSTGTPMPAAPVAAGITQKSPVGSTTILAAIGVALLAAAAVRRK